MTKKKYSPGGDCCSCPSVSLANAANWSGVDPGDGVALVDGFLVVTGTVEPSSTITGKYAEAFLIDFKMRGTLTVTVEGVAIEINDTAGTVSIGSNSGEVPKASEATDQEYTVQIRVTPNHLFASVQGHVNYGTAYQDDGLGVIVTATLSATPDGTFAIEGGEFKDLTTASTYVEYDESCYGSDNPIELCVWEPRLPINYRAYKDAMDGGTTSRMEYRHDEGAGEILWPDITYTGATPTPSGTYNGDPSTQCRVNIVNHQIFLCSSDYALTRLPDLGLTTKAGRIRSCSNGPELLYEFGADEITADLNGALPASLSTQPTSIQGEMSVNYTSAWLRELLETEYEFESSQGAGDWSVSPFYTLDNRWPFLSPYTSVGPVFLSVRYELDPSGECGDPYPLPKMHIGFEDLDVEFAANSVLNGATLAGTEYDYSF